MASKRPLASKSACEEMAAEILAQQRVVEVDRVSFRSGPATLQMVTTTTGMGWLLNGSVLFRSDQSAQIASAFFNTLVTRAEVEDGHFCVRFGDTDVVVWRTYQHGDQLKALAELAALIEAPPTLVSE